MTGRSMSRTSCALTAAAIGLAIIGGINPARAALITTALNMDFTSAPASINLGAAGYVFSAVPGARAGEAPAAVTTTGTALVSSFLGGVADFGAGSAIDQTMELYGFSAFPAPATIPYSAADDFIGLAFTLADGLHYGFAEIAGTLLIKYAYETTPNAGVTTSVPEPATLLVLAVGAAGLMPLRRRKGRQPVSATA